MPVHRVISQLLITGTLTCTIQFSALAQNCPANIDFETGTFAGWTCYIGTVASLGGQNVISLNPSGVEIYNRHTMYSYNPGDGLDEYGGFPRNCPNGSGHSIRLGNNEAGTQAEGISYDFTIPATANVYNLIYNYAVVFQDPAHQPSEQPRMEIEITNVSDNSIINCSSFTFYPIGSALPGFELSPVSEAGTPVWFKKWTAVSINLDGLAGKTIRLFFKTADCTFRRHFGYAYIDVNTECSDKFVGANFCPDDTAVTVVAPYGYESYTWYDISFTQILGTGQTLSFAPPPATGTSLAVVLIPYNGYGCIDTLYTQLSDTLSMKANAGPDLVSCNKAKVGIGIPPKPGWFYHWSPSAGLTDSEIANPLANPDFTTTYYLSIHHDGGGCRSMDTVIVVADNINDSLQLLGKLTWCIGSGDSTVLIVQAADSIQWFRDGIAIPGAGQTMLRVTQTGEYFARLHNNTGCTIDTELQDINISSIPVPIISVNSNAQCQLNNKFVFTNNSTNDIGLMQYKWKFGDGDSSTTRSPTHVYQKAGVYKVVMIVYSNSICADSAVVTVNVFQNVAADFSISPVCTNLPMIPVNNTIEPGTSAVHYLWSFGNGITSTQRNPPAQVYTAAGNYIVSLSVSTDQCPFPVSKLMRYAYVDAPKPATTYPVQIAVINFPLSLQARSFGDNILWTPATNLDDPASYTPVFIGSTEQLYKIEIRTNSGCLTVDTQLVKVHPNVEVRVPGAFTPDNNRTNDYLKPLTIGIKSLNFFRVFNRWGQIIFETHNLEPGWNGRFKGALLEMQTVVWMFEGIGVDNAVYRRQGSSVLIR